ncbi:MAG: hypothetical protein HY816_21850 [Candidatus Wallbacteria bacterium]|nr:hypothetical protein [Candidatus Wallbacteria bacterium]
MVDSEVEKPLSRGRTDRRDALTVPSETTYCSRGSGRMPSRGARGYWFMVLSGWRA